MDLELWDHAALHDGEIGNAGRLRDRRLGALGDLLEGIVLHAFDGKCPFGAESLKRIKDLKKFYGLDLDSRASHRLTESTPSGPPRKGKRGK